MKNSLLITGVIIAILEAIYNLGMAGVRIVDYWPKQRGEIWTVELELADTENPEEISTMCQDLVDSYSLQSAGVIFNRNY